MDKKIQLNACNLHDLLYIPLGGDREKSQHKCFFLFRPNFWHIFLLEKDTVMLISHLQRDSESR